MPLPRNALADVLWKIHRAIWALSGGRLGAATAGLPVLDLTTIGRTSGEPRSALIHYLAHGDAFVVIGSNVGRDDPPAWSLNLMANPRAKVTMGGRTNDVTARVASGEERVTLWRMAVAAKSDIAVYTTRADRKLPVFVLEPVGLRPTP